MIQSIKESLKFSDLLIQITAILGILATLRAAYITIRSKNINEQRIIWREHIRKLALIIAGNGSIKSKQDALNELSTRLNPCDKFDKQILKKAHILAANKNGAHKDKNEFINLVSLLLKHDWERCKREAEFIPWCYKVVIMDKNKKETLALTENTTLIEVRFKLRVMLLCGVCKNIILASVICILITIALACILWILNTLGSYTM
ncbi:hypothetical protein [Proteus mirabilis]|uniref:hypothetical protein n=1 Tax=Proteus mirabilis TaxID=584 RepID=UPI0018C680A5|nr:hypothetical protein [Proteus mirabilis]HEJ9686802.1 hypothetical protein [Proteus mirabilis]HEJ9738554.1 hypothetical protein [Proteus mirabilis]